MTVIKICAEQITTFNEQFSGTITCTDPACTPVVGAGNECNVAVYNVGIDLGVTPPVLCFSFDTQLEYVYTCHGATFHDFCNVLGSTTCMDLPEGVTMCCDLSPTWTYSATCDPGSITTTSDSVSGPVTISFTLDNLCVPTVICMDTTTCP